MSAPSAKRARVDTDDDINTGDDITASLSKDAELSRRREINNLIADLDDDDRRDLLNQAAMAHPDVLMSLRAVVTALEAHAASIVVDFNGHSSDVWRMLNVTYRNSSRSAQHEAAGQVESLIIDCMNDIRSHAAKRYASFGTKRNGLEALRKIGKSVVTSSNPLAHEVQKLPQWDYSLIDVMLDIVLDMTPEECEMMCLWNDGRGPWQDKLHRLVRLSRQQCCLKGLDGILEMLLRYMKGNEKEKKNEEYRSEGFHEDDDQDDGEDENVTNMKGKQVITSASSASEVVY